MGNPTALLQSQQIAFPAAETRVEKYIRLHAGDLRAVMAAFENEQGAEAIAALENELWMATPDPVFLMICLEELLHVFDTTTYSDLIDHCRWYAGPNLIGAWNFHGARISDLVAEGCRLVEVSPSQHQPV